MLMDIFFALNPDDRLLVYLQELFSTTILIFESAVNKSGSLVDISPGSFTGWSCYQSERVPAGVGRFLAEMESRYLKTDIGKAVHFYLTTSPAGDYPYFYILKRNRYFFPLQGYSFVEIFAVKVMYHIDQ